MKIQGNLPKLFVLAFLALGVGIFVSKFVGTSGNTTQISVTVPVLSALAQEGEKAFAANCATCHGVNAAGTDKGPPLVHDIYNPGHHDDESFFRAARSGVQQHHWPYGNMPAQPRVSEADVRAIVQYARELQIANGIKFRPHNM